MSTYERKFEAALEELDATGMWHSNYNPPILRTLKAMGFKPRPPHYAGFWGTAGVLALWFGPVWGLLMWFLRWQSAGFPVLVAVGASAVAGVLFGLLMAAYYGRTRRKYGLSRWEDL